MLQPALLGGVFIGVMSALPIISIGNCCCLWITGGGALAAYLDQAPGRRGNLGRGAVDGLLAGVIGAFVWLAGAMLFDALMFPIMRGALERAIDAAATAPPEVRDLMQMFGERDNPLRYAMGFAFQFFAGIVFSTLGGLLGALFFWRDGVEPALGGPQPPPPIPPQL